MDKLKSIVNQINFIASIGFGGLGFYLFFFGNRSDSYFYIILSILLLITVLMYKAFYHLKSQVHRSAAVLNYLSSKVGKIQDDDLHKNKLMTLVFISDIENLRKNFKTITESSWSWTENNPVNPLVSNLLLMGNNLDNKKTEYFLNSEELSILDQIINETKDLKKIEVDAYIFKHYPKLRNFEVNHNQILNLKEIYE